MRYLCKSATERELDRQDLKKKEAIKNIKLPTPKWAYGYISKEDFKKDHYLFFEERLADWMYLYRDNTASATASMNQMMFLTSDKSLNVIIQLLDDTKDYIGFEYIVRERRFPLVYPKK